MKKIYFLILVGIGISGLFSCRNTCACTGNFGLTPSLVSFSPGDRDTLVIKEFTKGSGYSSLLDSILIDSGNSVYHTHNDTTDIFSSAVLLPKYDYELFFPSSNLLIKITDIDEPQVEGNCPSKTQCIDPVNSYKINGSLITKSNPYDNLIYIQN